MDIVYFPDGGDGEQHARRGGRGGKDADAAGGRGGGESPEQAQEDEQGLEGDDRLVRNCLSLTLNNTQDEKSKRLQEKVDSIAMYLFPCIFLVFNSIYWPYYLFYEQNRI